MAEQQINTNDLNPQSSTLEQKPVGGDGASLITEEQAALLKKEKVISDLSSMTKSDMNDLKVNTLRKLCKYHNLPVAGKKEDLVKRLWAKKLGGDRQVVHGNNLCRYCGAAAYVNGSRVVTVLPDKRRVVAYSMKCTGKRNHRYTVTQTEGAVKKS